MEPLLRYIGAGAVAFGGLFTLLRGDADHLGLVRGAREVGGAKKWAGRPRTEREIPLAIVGGALVTILLLWLLPLMRGRRARGRAMVLFSFFFVTVSSRIVGLIGPSSNPMSGMTIAVLL